MTDNLLSLQQKFNNLGANQLGERERNAAMTDRYGNNEWNAQRPNQFYNKRNTTQPGSQQFKKRSNSNIGKGSRLASNPRDTEEYPPRIDSWNQVPQQLKSQKRRNPLAASTLTPQAYRRPMDSSIDDAQKRMDDMMLYNSQKQQKLLSNERQRLPPPTHYSPARYSQVNTVQPQAVQDRRGHFDEQDFIRDQVNKIWFKHDVNRSGALDKVETANFLRDFCASQGKPAPNMKTYQRFFFEFDSNRDGLIQKQEMARFIKSYLDATRETTVALPQLKSDEYIREQVDKVWYQYDVDGSNYLDKPETMNFLKNFLQDRNQPAPTIAQFNRFFQESDLNGDGVISRNEMARFFKKFMVDPLDAKIAQMVEEIWYEYDVDRSGWLDKRETLVFLKDVLNDNGQGPPTVIAYNKWFAEYDLNGNGTLEKNEMAAFVRKFFTQPLTVEYPLEKLVNELFERHDLNRNGALERREALGMINELLKRKGEAPATLSQFNRLYQEIDLNNDGVISRFEALLFVKNFLNLPIEEDEDVQIMTMNIFNKYDANRNGFLERRETLALLDELLAQRGQPPATVAQFNRFFAEVDINNDGVLSKAEMAKFCKNFINDSQVATAVAPAPVDGIVMSLFDKYDTNNSGFLEKKEALRLLNDLLANKGQPPATYLEFNKFFSAHDDNGDGVLSRAEGGRFVRKFLGHPPTAKDLVAEQVGKIWLQYDTDRSGYLSRMETLRFLNDYLASKNLPPATMAAFNRFFNELDVNGDDVLSRGEMAKFVYNFYKPQVPALGGADDLVIEMVDKIFLKYDVDRSGYLEKRECLRLVDDILSQKGQPQATVAQFNRFFAEFDANGDGVLSRSEMARFTRKFLKNQEVIPLGQISSTVDKIWVKYDLDRSGFLNRRETLKFLNDFLVTKGQPPATIAKFNQFFREIDLNSDGYVSRSEMAQFIKGYLTAPQVTDPVTELTNKIFAKYDFNRNGFLDKRECLQMLDEVLANRGQPKTTIPQFNRFFEEYDVNSDGVISKAECARFVKKFINPTSQVMIAVLPNLSVQDKASVLMSDIQQERDQLLRQNRNQVRGPRTDLMQSANPLVGRDRDFDELDQVSNSNLVKKFFDEYHNIINDSIDTGVTLNLLNVLEQIFLIDSEILKEPTLQDGHSRYSNLKQIIKEQKNNLTIQSNTLPEQDHIQTNLFKICCAILNLKPGQRGMPYIDDNLLAQYLDQIVVNEPYQTDENLLAQVSVIKNLINRKSFSLTDKQILQINYKFKNMSIHRQEFLFEMNKANKAKQLNEDQYLYKAPVQRSMYIPATDLSRMGPQRKPMRNVSRSPATTNPMVLDDALYGPQTARVPATTQKGYKPRKGTWEEDRLGATNIKRNLPICVLSVELDGNNTEKLKVYEGEDPELVVQNFGMKYNLSDNAMRRLLKQIEQQLMLY